MQTYVVQRIHRPKPSTTAATQDGMCKECVGSSQREVVNRTLTDALNGCVATILLANIYVYVYVYVYVYAYVYVYVCT